MSQAVTVLCLVGLAVVVTDIFVTVLKSGGDGFLAHRLTNGLWTMVRKIHRRRTSHRLLSNVGVALVAALPLIWLIMMWFLWSVVYLVNGDSVLNATTKQPSDGWSKVYFAGYSLFTSGLGDHVPSSWVWQLLTIATTAMGLGLVTLAVTFLVPVLQAANARRSCARTISQLGNTSDELSENVDLIEVAAPSMAAAFASVVEQHTSYPMLEHLHTRNEQNDLSVQLDHLHSVLRAEQRAADAMPEGQMSAELRLLDLALEDLVLSITPSGHHDWNDLAGRLERFRWTNGWDEPNAE